MTPKDVETVYETLAQTLDQIDAVKRELFLAKLALLLARDLNDVGLVHQRVAEAARNLDV